MKNLITPSYTFTPGASGVGTIDTNIVNFDIKLLYAIINVTRETIIYTPAISGRGYTNITGDTITLEFDTTGHNSGDILQFIYDSTADYPSVVDASHGQLMEAIESLTLAVMSLQKSIGAVYGDPLTGRMRVQLEGTAGTVAATQSGVWNITNLATIGSQNANSAIPSLERMAAQQLRNNITLT